MKSAVSPADLPELRPEALGDSIYKLCALGNRFVGTPGERAARETILGEFRKAGLAKVRLEELTVLAYRPHSASCAIVGETRPLPTVGLQFTASSAVEAEAIYIGSGTAQDIEMLEARGASIDGKIVVLHSYWPYEVATALLDRRAAGLVVIGETPDRRIGHSTAQMYPPPQDPEFAGRPLPIPGVTIEAQAARGLLALMSIGQQRLMIGHRADYVATLTANVIGEIPSREAPAERVVIGAHYDTQLEGVGACDNATGVAALIEIGRTWSGLRLRRTVVLGAFADEEHGFWGSVDYCRRHANELDATVGMVNLDALGWVYPARRSLHADPSIRSFALESARVTRWEPEEEVEANLLQASDHNPFIDAGVPACLFWRYPPQHPYFHTVGDDPELLDLDIVAGTATAAAYTAFRLAQEPDPSLGRSRPTIRRLDLRPEGSAV